MVAVAVNVTIWFVVDFNENDALPLMSVEAVLPDVGVIAVALPVFVVYVKVRSAPATFMFELSAMCTDTVEAATPSAASDVGDAVKFELLMLNPFVEEKIVAEPHGLGPMTTPLTVAVKLTVPGVELEAENT